MKLLTKEIQRDLPKLYETANKNNPVAYVKFFTPDANWTWYILEGEEQENGDWLFFAYVQGIENEYGYVLLSELESVRGPFGLKVERDIFFRPTPLEEILSGKGSGNEDQVQ